MVTLDPRDCIAHLTPLIDDLAKVRLLMQWYGVPLPKAKTEQGLKLRLLCPIWWRRMLKRLQNRAEEKQQIDKGHVRKGRQIYVSDRSQRKAQRAYLQALTFMQQMSMVSHVGDVIDMETLIARSLANPNNRRAELMIRMAGFEIFAQALGWVGEFVTLTCPSAYHRYSNGQLNTRYNPTYTPRVAQEYLVGLWAKVRAKLARDGIKVFGFRVAEPHHDGCPHWHMLLFVAPEHVEALRDIIRHYALEQDGDEPGAAEFRCNFKAIDTDIGSATGYIAKYISKNLGFSIDDPEHDQNDDSRHYGRRVKAWASVWGIRQFQQIGGAPVTVWRQLRKLGEGQADPILEQARQAADQSRWADYLQIMTGGDLQIKRVDMAVQLLKFEEVGTATGELKANRYAEIQTVIYGVCTLAAMAITKTKCWTLQSSKSALSEVAGQVRGGEAARAPAIPWSPVNNCTRPLAA
ncbi:hypothetical protein BJL95_21375 [Methylomonas sp. LWB]|uniref:replication endonuclease n=1 Tax=Methylomonas sp. LWB TaxID=1905845 RepID=UPI0008D9E01C|nr:replication endonuclease [Methylomonas sp. LWB]OHX37219.1 hypothetical protein BJL95_21375 [Methylomonas sp. LWB]